VNRICQPLRNCGANTQHDKQAAARTVWLQNLKLEKETVKKFCVICWMNSAMQFNWAVSSTRPNHFAHLHYTNPMQIKCAGSNKTKRTLVVFNKCVNLINGIKYSVLILNLAFPVFVIGNGFDKSGEVGLFCSCKISTYEAGCMEKIRGYVFEENVKLTGWINPVCLSPHLSQERLKLTLSDFDCGGLFSGALPLVEQPASDKANGSGKSRPCYRELTCRLILVLIEI
jgi:hypothetical protein